MLNVLRGQNRLVLGGSLHWIFQYLLNKGVPLFELTLLEDDFVCRFLENKSFDDFPNNKIAKTLDDDIRAILQSFTANALFKILVG